MKEDELTDLESRAKSIEDSICWWEEQLDKALLDYEEALEGEDELALSKCEDNLKALLRRAELEKVEMAKIESRLNESCAEAAFKGNFSVFSKRKKNG